MQEGLPPGLQGRVAFHSDREGRTKLYVLDLGSGTIAALTRGSEHRDEDPEWSPDGSMIAFATTRFGTAYDIAVADAGGGRVRQLTSYPANERHPAWTADGRGLFFSGEQDGTQAVFHAPLDTGDIRRISPPPARALMPAAGPERQQITYTFGMPDGLRVVQQDLETRAVRAVTAGSIGAARGRWSPDGTRLVYSRLQPATTFLEVLDASSGASRALRVQGLQKLDDGAWSPDGRFVVASGSHGTGEQEDWDLVVVALKGPRAYRVTSGRAADRSPSWSAR